MEARDENEILFERRGAVGIATLNRPRALNALTENMVVLLLRQYTQWNADPSIAAIVLRGYDSSRDNSNAAKGGGGAPRAFFCAGGDVKTAASAVSSGRPDVALSFFGSEYRLNLLISRLRKPHVALIDGVVMGGGAGLSVHGSHRVATRETLFAMPECAIGLFPDVGTTFFLPRACGVAAARWIALTGARLRGKEVVDAGVATHLVARDKLEGLVDALCAALSSKGEEGSSSPSSSSSWIPCLARKIFSPLKRRTSACCPVAAVLAEFEDKESSSSSASSSSYPSFAADVEHLFGAKNCSSLSELREAVSREVKSSASPSPPEWLRNAATALETECPQSQALSWALLEEASPSPSPKSKSKKPFTVADTLKLEWRILHRVSLASPSSDFVEGVTAKLLSKPSRPARWRGAADAGAVAAALAPFVGDEQGRELEFEGEGEGAAGAACAARPRL